MKPTPYTDNHKFHVENPFMGAERRQIRRQRVFFVLGLMLLALAGGVLAMIFRL